MSPNARRILESLAMASHGQLVGTAAEHLAIARESNDQEGCRSCFARLMETFEETFKEVEREH